MRTESIHIGKTGANVTPEKYNAMREAILRALPTAGDGMTWDSLVEAIAPHVPQAFFPHLGSVRWYAKSVQLDLEAKKIIERVPGSKPLRFRRLPQ